MAGDKSQRARHVALAIDAGKNEHCRFHRALSLERDKLWLDPHPTLAFCLSMIFSENRFPLFRIML
jgi:hypothetical protein